MGLQSNDDYESYYKMVKRLAREKNWSDTKIKEMLMDRKKFEKEYNWH